MYFYYIILFVWFPSGGLPKEPGQICDSGVASDRKCEQIKGRRGEYWPPKCNYHCVCLCVFATVWMWKCGYL